MRIVSSTVRFCGFSTTSCVSDRPIVSEIEASRLVYVGFRPVSIAQRRSCGMIIVVTAVMATTSHAKMTCFLYGPKKDSNRRWVDIRENLPLVRPILSDTNANVKY